VDINPNNNRDTFKGRGVRIKELEEQVEQLKQKLLESEQTKGLLCEKCGWSMKFPDEPCRCELEEKLLYKQERFDKLWDLCCDTQFTAVALRFFEKWENE
jgi:hypothetical protein